MNPIQFLLTLRAHYKVALIAAVGTLLLGLVATMLMPKKYEATTSLVFDMKSPDPIAGIAFPMGQGYMATQIEIMQSDRLAEQVISSLKLDQNPQVVSDWKKSSSHGSLTLQQWLGDGLKRGLSISVNKAGANIVDITYSATDPVFAAAAANAYANGYIGTSITLRTDPARQFAQWFGEQAKITRDKLEEAQTKLSEYQQKNGIVSKDEESDAETVRLNELYAQLTAAQEKTVEIRSRTKPEADGGSDVTQNPLVLSLKNDVARQETKLREAGENLGRNHPQYQRMEVELASLKNQLEMEKLNVAREVAVSKNVAIDKEGQIRAEINAQKKRLLGFKGHRDELSVLQRDVDAAQAAYDNVIKRYNQTTLESQVAQTNVSVLNPAVEPSSPASPSYRKNALLTLLASLIAGCGAALLLEFLDRRVRSVQDLEQMLQVPILAVIASPKKSGRAALLTNQVLKLESK